MKLKTSLLMLFGSILLTVGPALTGCATTGVSRAEKTTNTMQNVENDYKQVYLRVDATNASLRDLIGPSQIDRKIALDNYRDNVARMEQLGDRLDIDSADMSAKGQDYFAEWKKQGATYSDPQIRNLSEERRHELRDIFARIPEASTGVKEDLHAYLVDIKEIRDYLSTDLTPLGIQGITPVAAKAMQKGEELKGSVRPVLAAIENARTAMAQGGTSRGTATGGQQPKELRPDVQPQNDEQLRHGHEEQMDNMDNDDYLEEE